MNAHAPVADARRNAGASDVPRFRVWLLSDLRVHETRFVPPSDAPDHDVVLVAGNVRPGLAQAVRWAGSAFGRRGRSRVAFVPGPLEFEDGVPVPEALALGAEAAREVGVELLHDASIRVGGPDGPGLHIVGATLWPSFSIDGAAKAREARGHGRSRWKSCRTTRSAPGLPFLPHDAVGAHARSRAFIEDGLRSVWANSEGRGGKPPLVGTVRGGDRGVVATAFPPLRSCLPPGLARPLLDHWAPNWLASDLDGLLDGFDAPVAWLHGGLPHALDMRVGRTRLVANPHGPGDPTSGFDARRVVTI